MLKLQNTNKKECVHKGHRERVRNGIVENGGFAGMPDHEVLEYMLSMAIPRKDTNPLAHALINYFGSFSNVLDAEVNDLLKVKGIGERTAVFLSSIKLILKRYKESKASKIKKLTNPKQVREFIGERIRFLPKEECYAIYLNSAYAIISCVQIGLSGNERVLLEPKTIIENALAVKASGVIIAHNHPSNLCEPSKEDIALTRQIFFGLKFNGVDLLDHYIYTSDSEYSFNESQKIKEFNEEFIKLHSQ